MREAQLRTAGAAAPAGTSCALIAAAAVLAGILACPPDAAALGFAGDPQSFGSVPSLLVPTHGASEDELDRDGAIKGARHIVEELSADKQIDEGWKAAAVAGAETRTMRVFKMWVVHFRSAADIGGNGTDLYVFLSLNGEFLKYSYNGR